MSRYNFFRFFLVLIVAFPFSGVCAQQDSSAEKSINENRRAERRPNLFRELALSPQQRQQIKQLNANRKTSIQQAQRRVREATRNLDQAIYADSVNQAEIDSRLKELQAAQADIARLRAANELDVRNILSAEQLVKFRELRRQFAERRQNLNERRQNPSDESKIVPNRRFNRRLRKVSND